ncbi:MAG: MFS transporter [Candidatus Bathyarchaeia archaeon]
MLDDLIVMFREMDRRVKVMLASQVVYNFPIQLTSQYNMLFAQSLGAGENDIGLINSVSAAVHGVFSAPIGLALEKYSVKKMTLLGLLCDVVATIIFISAGVWYMLVPAFILYFHLIRHMPIADMIIITFTDPNKRATLMSLVRLFRNFVSLVAPIIAAAIVTSFGGISPQGIRPLYYVSLGIFVLVFLLILKFLGETYLGSQGKNSSTSKRTNLFKEYLEFLKGKKYVKKWILIKLFARDGFQTMLGIFAPLWIVNVKGATPAILGIVATLSLITEMLLQVPAGRFADKFGRKKAFFVFTLFYCLGVFVLIWAPSYEYLILAGMLGGATGSVIGGVGGVAFIPFITMWWEVAPKESRGKLYGLDNILITASRIPASIIGGLLWDLGFKTLTLLTPVLVELFVVIPLLFTVSETLNPNK